MNIVIAAAPGSWEAARTALWRRASGHDAVAKRDRHASRMSAGARMGRRSLGGSIDGADAVVNLAGESIAGRRWTPAQKQLILDSRVRATRSLVAAIARAERPPAVLHQRIGGRLSTGRGRTRSSPRKPPPDSDFLAGVCVRWEGKRPARLDRTPPASSACEPAWCSNGTAARCRRCCRHSGSAPAARSDSGRQYWPWIHREDWIGLCSS